MADRRLPRNSKEGLLYGTVIALITVIVMLTLNVGTNFGKLDKEVLLIILKLIPIMLIIAMIVEEVIVKKIANKLLEHFVKPTDGFNSKILFNILFCSTFMSMIMTIIGAMIGMGKISLEPFTMFFVNWPRNFCVAFWCEVLLAQPIARKTMKIVHNMKKEL